MLQWFDSTLLLDNFAKMYVTEHREQLYSHTSFSGQISCSFSNISGSLQDNQSQGHRNLPINI